MRQLSIIIPAYNESARLPATLELILKHFEQHGPESWEILIVDDGSTDDTVAVAERYVRQDPKVRVLRNPGNRGKGYSVRHGMMKAEGAWALFSDADLSTPIEELQKLIQAAETNHADIAFGSRALDRSLVHTRQSPAREYAGRFFNLILRFALGLPYRDTQCGFKLFRLDAARAVFPLQILDGFSFDVEDLVIARSLGFKAIEVPVVWRNAEGTKVTLWRGIRSFLDLFAIWWNQLTGRYRRAES